MALNVIESVSRDTFHTTESYLFVYSPTVKLSCLRRRPRSHTRSGRHWVKDGLRISMLDATVTNFTQLI
jgi:hypothetical protein